jgi:hypothetical protein
MKAPERQPQKNLSHATTYGGISLKTAETDTHIPVQKKNQTGLPDNLKTGIENLSGYAMDDVKVHYNSTKPAGLQAHAYAQGTDIHIAHGQERHLPHEAWHVVQQKQGRVKATMQMKGTGVNDDTALEKEADVMGVKALQMKPVGTIQSDSGSWGTIQQRKKNDSPRPLRNDKPNSVVQRYTEQNGHRIANDHTAAVAVGVNNKLLYTTQGRIDESNQALENKSMPVRLDAGAQRNGLVHDQVLLTVTPRFTPQVGNQMPDTLTPQGDVVHGVLLPAECEKGAISIIGAFTKTQKSGANTYVYNDKDHANARIGELLAQSTAGNGAKNAWYQRWSDLDEGVAKAVTARNRNVYEQGEMNLMFTALNNANLLREFRSDFDLVGNRYEANYVYSALARSRSLFERIIRTFDKSMADIETEIMRTVDTGTVGEQAELVNADTLKGQLINFFAHQNYDKAAIDQAIAMVPEQAQLLQALQDGFAANRAGNAYVSTAFFGKDAKLEALAQSVLGSIDRHVAALTARNTKSLQAGSGLNAEVDPEIGESYGIVGGHYNFTEGGRWNWHWASVIMKTLNDNITMEAHASHRIGNETHNDRWDFKMYGTAVAGNQTFHDEWKGDGFGKAPVTVLGVARDNPIHEGLLTPRGITGLSAIETTAAIACAETFYDYLVPLSNTALTQHQLMAAHQPGRPALDDLPALFMANYLQPDLNDLDLAMQDLINNVGTAQEQLDRTVDVNDAAIDLKPLVKTFYILAKHYQGHKKKQGIFP